MAPAAQQVVQGGGVVPGTPLVVAPAIQQVAHGRVGWPLARAPLVSAPAVQLVASTWVSLATPRVNAPAVQQATPTVGAVAGGAVAGGGVILR